MEKSGREVPDWMYNTESLPTHLHYYLELFWKLNNSRMTNGQSVCPLQLSEILALLKSQGIEDLESVTLAMDFIQTLDAAYIEVAVGKLQEKQKQRELERRSRRRR